MGCKRAATSRVRERDKLSHRGVRAGVRTDGRGEEEEEGRGGDLYKKGKGRMVVRQKIGEVIEADNSAQERRGKGR